jgi:hypothetical protein
MDWVAFSRAHLGQKGVQNASTIQLNLMVVHADRRIKTKPL